MQQKNPFALIIEATTGGGVATQQRHADELPCEQVNDTISAEMLKRKAVAYPYSARAERVEVREACEAYRDYYAQKVWDGTGSNPRHWEDPVWVALDSTFGRPGLFENEKRIDGPLCHNRIWTPYWIVGKVTASGGFDVVAYKITTTYVGPVWSEDHIGKTVSYQGETYEVFAYDEDKKEVGLRPPGKTYGWDEWVPIWKIFS